MYRQLDGGLDRPHSLRFGLADEMADTEGMAISLDNLGVAYLNLGAPEKALRFFHKSLTLAQELGHTELIINVLIGLAQAAGTIDKPKTSLRLVGAVDKLCEATSTSLPALERELRKRTMELVGTRFDNQAIAEGLKAGQLLSLDEALVEAAGLKV
jgi:hypothetical protein